MYMYRFMLSFLYLPVSVWVFLLVLFDCCIEALSLLMIRGGHGKNGRHTSVEELVVKLSMVCCGICFFVGVFFVALKLSYVRRSKKSLSYSF